MFITKYLIASLIAFSYSNETTDGWVSVSRPEKVVHEFTEEDPSIWVVLSKTFGNERVLIRFPQDPAYRYLENGGFEATSSQSFGETSLIVQKKSASADSNEREVEYFDPHNHRFVREKHIDTKDNHYILRVSLNNKSASLFHQFTSSFEIEMSS